MHRHPVPQGRRWIRRGVRALGLLAVAVALSGCVVVPAYGPRYGYYRPHPYYW